MSKSTIFLIIIGSIIFLTMLIFILNLLFKSKNKKKDIHEAVTFRKAGEYRHWDED